MPSRIVCLICDVHKPHAASAASRDHCDGCGQRTPNREVAPDHALIAPGSALRYRDQRRIYQDTRTQEDA